MEERISKKQLMELYGVNRNTIEDWRRTKGLKMIEITSHSKYILKNDLIEWENSLKPKDRVKGFKNDMVSK
jgi:hypothetical protein